MYWDIVAQQTNLFHFILCLFLLTLSQAQAFTILDSATELVLELVYILNQGSKDPQTWNIKLASYTISKWVVSQFRRTMVMI